MGPQRRQPRPRPRMPDRTQTTIMAPLVDSHCHLDFPDFEGQLPDIIARAAQMGVTRMVTICPRLRNEPSVRAIAENCSL